MVLSVSVRGGEPGCVEGGSVGVGASVACSWTGLPAGKSTVSGCGTAEVAAGVSEGLSMRCLGQHKKAVADLSQFDSDGHTCQGSEVNRQDELFRHVSRDGTAQIQAGFKVGRKG